MSDVVQLTPTDKHQLLAALPAASLPSGDVWSHEQLASVHRMLRDEMRGVASHLPTPIISLYYTNPQLPQVHGRFCYGTVLFADLSGFTALSSQLRRLGKQGAEEISLLINRLFDALVHEIQQANGYLMKFGGDALLAFFDQQLLERHAAAAAHAAIAIQQRMRDFAMVATRAGNFALGMRVGIHTGEIFMAHVGDAIHMECVLAGQTMNMVAQAQEHAVTGEIIITDASRSALPEATVQQQQQGFWLLQQMPPLLSSAPQSQQDWDREPVTRENTLRLAQTLASLRPYLPANLPRRFLEAQSQRNMGEFRRVTIMFIHFHGTSMITEELSETPDIASAVLNDYVQRVQQVIHHYGGIIDKIDLAPSGDKLMALFGAPRSHEDDAERAVRAALELQHVLNEANRAAKTRISRHEAIFRHRIGISTGTVFAGLVGSTTRHEYTVMGHHANVAARLMAAAGDGHILLAPSTRRAVERRFAMRDLPVLRLRGVPEPIAPAEPLYAYDVVHDVPSTLARPPLVGRQHTLDQIVRESRRGLRGSGRVISLVGEPGIGKTRLTEEALTSLVHASTSGAVPTFVPYTVNCQSYEQTTPYAAMRDLLRQMFSLPADSRKQGAHIEQVVMQRLPEQARFIPLLGDILGTPLENTTATAALSPEQRHERTIELLFMLITAETRQSPLIIIFDDLHWIDGSSLEVLNALAERTAQWPIVLLLAYRTDPPIQAALWQPFPHSVSLQIRELPADASASLAEHMLRGPLPETLLPVLERAQGNPFFIGEVIRELIDLGALRSGSSGWEVVRSVQEVSLPDSIEGIVIARLDRLGEQSREVLQAAAVVGRRFSHYVLAGLLAHSSLDERLHGLTRSELIHADDHDQPGAYLFTHALTRDVAYEAILYAQRRDLHQLVAHQIEHLYSDRLDPHLTLLARHYRLAEQWEQAFLYHMRAGRNAQLRYANRESIELFTTAIELLPHLNAYANSPQAVEAHERLGYTYAMTSEYDQALHHYETALTLLQRQSNYKPDDMLRLHHHIARVFEKRAEFERAFEWVEQALALSGNVTSRDLARCLLLGAGLHRRQGRTNQAIAWGERALLMAQQIQDTAVKAHALKLLGISYLHLGSTEQAYALLRDSVDVYAQCNDISGRGDAHNDLANTCYELGRMDEARQHYEAALSIKEVIGDRYGQAMVSNNLGEVLKLQGNFEEATKQYQHSLDLFQRIKSVYGAGVLHMNLGAVYIRRGMADNAAVHLRQSAELYEQAGAEESLPELERYIAELQVLRGDLSRAHFAIELALATADRLEARSEEGTTRRLYGQILVLTGQVHDAWEQMITSLTMLRETATPLEVARTNLAIAMLAPHLKRKNQGQHALNEAFPTLEAIGARHDVEEALQVATMHGYTINQAS